MKAERTGPMSNGEPLVGFSREALAIPPQGLQSRTDNHQNGRGR